MPRLSAAAQPRWLQPVNWLWAAASALTVLLVASAALLIQDEHAAAQREAEAEAQAAVETYQQQMLRSLREIDQALRVIALAVERQPVDAALESLRRRDLMLPEQLFSLTLDGQAVPAGRRVAGPDGLVLGLPAEGGHTLVFSREVSAGLTASIEVDSSYFLAGYDPLRLGRQGLLALIATDGGTLAQRDGDRLLLAGMPLAHRPGLLRAGALYGWPLLVAAGVSADERLAPSRARARLMVAGAALGGLAAFAVAGVVARLWRRLEQAGREHAQRIEAMALRDALTGLANRHGLEMMLAHHASRSERHGDRLSLLFLDLDGFKAVNDLHGHETGDGLLRQVAERLTACLRVSDVVARLGGDEFVALLVQPDSDEATQALARRVIAELARPYRVGGIECRVTASVGVAHHRGGAVDIHALMRRADAAMYRAKTGGKNTIASADAA